MKTKTVLFGNILTKHTGIIQNKHKKHKHTNLNQMCFTKRNCTSVECCHGLLFSRHFIYLCQFLIFEWHLPVIADLPQRRSKTPLVCSNTEALCVFNTLWGNPWNPLHTFWIHNTNTKSAGYGRNFNAGSKPFNT